MFPTLVKRILPAVWVMASIGAMALAQASPITYHVDSTVGDTRVVGNIQTDGTIGALGPGNVLDFDLILHAASADEFLSMSEGAYVMEMYGGPSTSNATMLASSEFLYFLNVEPELSSTLWWYTLDFCSPLIGQTLCANRWELVSRMRVPPDRSIVHPGQESVLMAFQGISESQLLPNRPLVVLGKIPEPSILWLLLAALPATRIAGRGRRQAIAGG